MKNFDILQIKHAYKTQGLIYAARVAFSLLTISTITWLYKNVKFVRNIITRRFCKQSPYLRLVLDLFMYGYDDENYFKSIIRRLPRNQQKRCVKEMLKYKHGKNKNNTV